MPCPLFEPRERLILASDSAARFPLLAEFAGICHADGKEHSTRFCNHGNAKGECSRFPDEMPVSAVRFDVTAKTSRALTILVIEEQNHWPHAWSRFQYLIAEERLEPEIEEICRRAQVFHFCRNYLGKFKCQ